MNADSIDDVVQDTLSKPELSKTVKTPSSLPEEIQVLLTETLVSYAVIAQRTNQPYSQIKILGKVVAETRN